MCSLLMGSTPAGRGPPAEASGPRLATGSRAGVGRNALLGHLVCGVVVQRLSSTGPACHSRAIPLAETVGYALVVPWNGEPGPNAPTPMPAPKWTLARRAPARADGRGSPSRSLGPPPPPFQGGAAISASVRLERSARASFGRGVEGGSVLRLRSRKKPRDLRSGRTGAKSDSTADMDGWHFGRAGCGDLSLEDGLRLREVGFIRPLPSRPAPGPLQTRAAALWNAAAELLHMDSRQPTTS